MILKMPRAHQKRGQAEHIEAIGNCGTNAVRMLGIYEDEIKRIGNEKIIDAGWGDHVEIEKVRRVGKKIHVVLNVLD